jgi:flagellar protein FlaG
VYAGAALNSVTGVVDNRAQPALAATAPAVPTELPAAQAISQAANIPATRNDVRKTENPGPSRAVIIDPQTNSVVYQSLDARTGNVIEQVPTQALLRRRAYVDAQAVQALIKGKDLSAAALAAAQDVDTTA